MVIHSKEVILARDIRGGFLKGIEIEVNLKERERIKKEECVWEVRIVRNGKGRGINWRR